MRAIEEEKIDVAERMAMAMAMAPGDTHCNKLTPQSTNPERLLLSCPAAKPARRSWSSASSTKGPRTGRTPTPLLPALSGESWRLYHSAFCLVP